MLWIPSLRRKRFISRQQRAPCAGAVTERDAAMERPPCPVKLVLQGPLTLPRSVPSSGSSELCDKPQAGAVLRGLATDKGGLVDDEDSNELLRSAAHARRNKPWGCFLCHSEVPSLDVWAPAQADFLVLVRLFARVCTLMVTYVYGRAVP